MTLVSIVILAYNHQNYIEQAVTSVTNQIIDFPYEILICYTKSNDHTEESIQSLSKKHSAIKLIYLDSSKSFAENTLEMTKCTKGKYFIIMDGDDYWVDNYKLQKQVDFLEQNTEYNGVFHDVSIINQADDKNKNEQLNYYSQFKSYSQFNTYKSDYYPWDAVNRIVIPPGSLLFRTNKLIENLDNLTLINFSGGWMITLYILKNSKFKYINEQWSVYRNHTKGITKRKSHDLFILSNIHVLKILLKDDYYIGIKWDIHKSISQEYHYLITSNSVQSKKKKMKYLLLSNYYYLKFVFAQLKRIRNGDT